MKSGWILDVDGVLVDFFPRYHQIFYDFITDARRDAALLSWYRRMRRQGKRDGELFTVIDPSVNTQKFYGWKASVTENNEYLRLDQPLPGARLAYRRLLNERPIVILSGRNERKRLIDELTRFGFDNWTSLFLSSKKDAPSEVQRIDHQLKRTGIDEWTYVGDGLDDAVFSRALGVPFIGVLTGITNRSRFLEFSSDMIVASTLSQVLS